MKVYFNLIALNLKSQMQYKVSFFLTTLGQFITAFTSFFGLYFIFSRVNAIDEFTYEQVLLSFAVMMAAFSLGQMLGGTLAVFPRMLGNGQFDRALVRPRNIILQVLMPNMDFTRLGLLVQALMVLCYAIPISGITWTWEKILTLCLMIFCGGVLFFGLFLFQAACSFFTVQSLDFMNIFTYGASQFGKYPFSVYGNFVLKFYTFVIPLALFQYYPLLYLLDREQNRLFMFLPVISLLFLIPCYAFFKFGMRRYKSIGS
ncbi:ABC transporter permease [Oceanirhabdus sp. W0125-5]|uniref:ABC transporter permease n=1 Tax=Oceanirhabdus sp. W0125-5 TaxID=2999116 RepID=UPI0022F2DD01|nr:ABC-2 family transporter protein [Oceanirhabdus sp. W0125-5]WBW97728.1 ABC-2 family transporter protein [Oceanirhabdus sp. W0125-5]